MLKHFVKLGIIGFVLYLAFVAVVTIISLLLILISSTWEYVKKVTRQGY